MRLLHGNPFFAAIILASISQFALSQDAPPPTQILINNVNIFDGVDDELHQGMNVLIVGNLIQTISDKPISPLASPPKPQQLIYKPGEKPLITVIDGAGRTLMPGLIDAHVHIMINADYKKIESDMDEFDLGIRSVKVVKGFLMDGFTTVRDMGGPAFATKRAIDRGEIVGPRVFPSGSFISQTSGHGDFRHRNDPNPTLNPGIGDVSNFGRLHIGTVADGRAAVLAATRQNLMMGATQIKIMAGGGGSSIFDPIDTAQFTADEIKAAVEAAADWNTYVGAHVFTDVSAQRLMKNGVKSLEHSFFISNDTMKMASKLDVFVVPQMWGISPEIAKNPLMPAAKIPMVLELGKKYADFGKRLLKHKVKVAFQSDYVGEYADATKARRYELYWRTQMFGSNHEVLKQATSLAGELLAKSGPRNNYNGKLGVIEEGALADILLVDGNPLEDISVIGAREAWWEQPDPETSPIDTLRLIIKDGVVYKNTLE